MAKTETHDTYPRIRILKLRYSYKVLLLIWKHCLSLYALVETLSFLPVVSISEIKTCLSEILEQESREIKVTSQWLLDESSLPPLLT